MILTDDERRRMLDDLQGMRATIDRMTERVNMAKIEGPDDDPVPLPTPSPPPPEPV